MGPQIDLQLGFGNAKKNRNMLEAEGITSNRALVLVRMLDSLLDLPRGNNG